MKGRRRSDVPLGELPTFIEPGDYWKYLDRETGEPMRVNEPSNLTGGVWGFMAPNMHAIGTLTKHTVREHVEDGTASIRRDDGSSNSVLITRTNGERFHGYLEHGVWETLDDSTP